MGYAPDSKHYDDMLRSFNNRVTAVLINHVVDYLTRIGIEMGTDEKAYQIEIKEGGIINLPYGKVVYDLEEKSANARRIDKCRAQKR